MYIVQFLVWYISGLEERKLKAIYTTPSERNFTPTAASHQRPWNSNINDAMSITKPG